MADTYTYLGGTSQIEVLPGGQTHDVIVASFTTVPSEVPFSLAIDSNDFTPDRLALIVPPVAVQLEKANAAPGVSDIQVFQNVNAAGQFVNELQADVTSSSGNTTVTITPPYGSIFDATFAKAAARTRANLDAIEQA